ncbi:MAG TPA: hypothetical protein VIY51_20350 [Xanthobacteraceae bacterium]
MKGHVLKRHLLAGVGLAALTAAGSAGAADRPLPPAPVAAWSWSGIYIGGHGGYGWSRDPFTDTVFFGKTPGPPLTDIRANGFVAGFQAGANWQSGSWVGGIEIDLSATGIKGSSSTTTGTLPFFGGAGTIVENATQTDKLDWLGSARARIGYLVFPDVLLYGTGGPAWARFGETSDQSAVITVTAPPPGTLNISSTTSTPTWRVGAVAGVGVETRLWNSNWLGRVEYLHYDFGKSDTFLSSDPANETITRGNLTLDVVRAALSYKLGQDSAIAGSTGAMPVKAPRLAAAGWTWSGFYIGGHAGYGWGHDPFTNPFGPFTLTGIESTGFVGGMQAGANWQARNAWVGGLELDISGSGIKASKSYATATRTVTQTDSFEMLGSARARLGYLFWPDVLFYGTGGLAWTRMVQTLDDVTTTATSDADTFWEFGWVAGFGLETRVWNSNWLARVEYLHYDFGDSGNFYSAGFTQTSGHLTTDVVRGALSYKFDWSNAVAAPARTAMPVKARPAIAAADWSGFYLGGHAGYGWGRDPTTDAMFGNKLGRTPQTDIHSNGYVAGFQAGANRQMGAFVAGLEVDLSATGIKGSSTVVDAVVNNVVETRTDRFDALGSARGRLGFLAGSNVLLYATGGLAWTRLNQSTLDVPIGAGGSTLATAPVWEFGWVAGGGGETRLWDTSWFWRAEYLHYDFGDSGSNSASITATVVGFPNSVTSHATGHLTTDVVRTALSYKFD